MPFFKPIDLDPVHDVDAAGMEQGQRAIVQDAAWASLVGALYGGVILVGFALELGASPMIIGLLAAIPFVMQVAQLPTIVIVERVRQRRRVGVVAVFIARCIILSLAVLPWLPVDPGVLLTLLLAAQFVITFFGAMAGCAINSWFHQLLAGQPIGVLYAKRLLWSTVLASAGALLAGQLVEHWPFGERLHAYAASFAGAGIAGFIGLRFLAGIPEPMMDRRGPPLPITAMLRAPFHDPNFRAVIVFMGSWNFASNLAAPFLTVYLIQQLDLGLGTVTSLWAVSQVSNALTLYAWGRLSDRLSNKAVLAVALPTWFACLIGLPASALPGPHALTLPLIAIIHMMMGVAGGGIGLATGNMGLKLAPQGRGTPYLAALGLVGAMAGGVASLTGGALADWFSARELSLTINWSSASHAAELTVLHLRHWEFLFGIAFALGFYVIHALSRIREGSEHSERAVIQEFVLESGRLFGQLSSAEAVRLATLFPLARLLERRRRARIGPLAESGAARR